MSQELSEIEKSNALRLLSYILPLSFLLHLSTAILTLGFWNAGLGKTMRVE